MILVDTGIWLQAMSGKKPKVAQRVANLLRSLQVVRHDLVYLELLLGSGETRDEIVRRYLLLPSIEPASTSAVAALVSERSLAGKSMGALEASLLAAAVSSGHQVWTEDGGLRSAAEALGVAYSPDSSD